jgi:hypothetical protein
MPVDDPGRIGDYAVLCRLGNGAMGTVYLGQSPGGRLVAVKLVREGLADDEEFRERFRREVDMARSVGGFWTAAVVDADPTADRPWLATEYVAGPSLAKAVSSHGPLPEPSVRRLAAGLAEALAAIHSAGLVHRDLKPANVLLASDGPRVIDFGIAKAAVAGAGLTATGVFFGTPGYLSPEQIAGADVGPASDVFALGAVLVYAATGRGPFGDGDTASLMYRAVHTDPDLRGVPAALHDLVAACLRRDESHRPSPAWLVAQLRDVVGPPPPDGAWLPTSVRNLVQQRQTELHRLAPPSATRTYTAVAPAPQPAPPPASSARFRTSRSTAVVWGSAGVLGALFAGGAADPASGLGASGRLLALCLFVALGFFGVRLLVRAIRPQHGLDVTPEGLLVSRGNERRLLPWSTIARTRVVEHRGKPWLAVWPAVPWDLSGSALFRPYHGGYRIYPVAHERRRSPRDGETRELRAALGWYGRTTYDPT